MMITSTSKGHEIIFENNEWYYHRTGKKLSDNSVKCAHCNSDNRKDGNDSCIGRLDGVESACCGHGDTENAYIKFFDGTVLEKEKVIEWMYSDVHK